MESDNPVAAAPGGARDRLLGAADRLFYRRGIRAVGVNEIVVSAGVAKTSLYLHFASKDDLVAMYLAGRTSSYINQWASVLAGSSELDPHARIDLIFDVLGLFVRSDGYRGCPFVNAAAELPDTSHAGYAAIVGYRRYVREVLFGSVTREASVPEPDAMAALLQVLYDGALAGSVIEGNDAPVQRARRIAHVVLPAAATAEV